jgi:hypothetical protein
MTANNPSAAAGKIYIQSGKAALKTARRSRVLLAEIGNPVFTPAGLLNKEAQDLHTLIPAN